MKYLEKQRKIILPFIPLRKGRETLFGAAKRVERAARQPSRDACTGARAAAAIKSRIESFIALVQPSMPDRYLH